jgi:hypothetical protein
MKKLFVILVLGLVTLVHADAPIYGYFWFRYTYDNPTTPEVDENEHYFSIERGYIRWQTKTSPVSFKGTIDISQKSGATNASDWNVRLKYAEADWTLPGIGDYLPDTKLILGLQKVYFGIVDLWEYEIIEKNLEEAEKKMNSADLGIGLHGLLPSGYGEYALQVFNGNGYTDVAETNTNKALAGNLALLPLPGVMLKGSIWYADQPMVIDTLVEQVAQNRYAGLLRVKYGPVTVIGEYLATEDHEIDGMGYMGFVKFDLTKAFSLLGRYDYFDKDTDTENDAHNRIFGGFNYHISRTLLAQVNYQIKTYEDEEKESEDKIQVQFKYSY